MKDDYDSQIEELKSEEAWKKKTQPGGGCLLILLGVIFALILVALILIGGAWYSDRLLSDEVTQTAMSIKPTSVASTPVPVTPTSVPIPSTSSPTSPTRIPIPTPIFPGSSFNGTLGPGEVDHYIFTTSDQSLVTIWVQPISGLAYRLQVLYLNGGLISGTSGKSKDYLVVAPEPDVDYMVRVWGLDANSRGSYIISMDTNN